MCGVAMTEEVSICLSVCSTTNCRGFGN